MAASNGLSVRGLTVQRGGRTVLEDASFGAPACAVTAVLGPAGAGKTSLLAALAGLLPAVRGAVFRGGEDVSGLPGGRRDVALLAPGTALHAAGTVRAALRRLAGRGRAAAADDRISALGLADQAARPLGALSHGEAALALAAARLLPPGGVLLVDEAGMGLDAEARATLAALLRMEAAGGRLVLLATRCTELAMSADHLVLLAGGQVLQAGTPASLYAEPRSAASARLTGPANILQGVVRELRPGGFVWSAGARYVQAADPDTVRPALGNPVTLCLRPERVALLGGTAAADNVVEATIIDLRSSGAMLDVSATGRIGPLRLSVPSWGTPCPTPGQSVRLGWAADAARVVS